MAGVFIVKYTMKEDKSNPKKVYVDRYDSSVPIERIVKSLEKRGAENIGVSKV